MEEYKIILDFGTKKIEAALNNTETARNFYRTLPVKLKATRWGGEYYGKIKLEHSKKDPTKQEMEFGELAFWPDGSALCIFFGKTPASIGEKPAAISPVIPLGIIKGDLAFLNELDSSIDITISSFPVK